MDSRVFSMLAIFKKPYFIFLDFPKGKLYLISKFHNIFLGFFEDIKSHVTL